VAGTARVEQCEVDIDVVGDEDALEMEGHLAQPPLTRAGRGAVVAEGGQGDLSGDAGAGGGGGSSDGGGGEDGGGGCDDEDYDASQVGYAARSHTLVSLVWALTSLTARLSVYARLSVRRAPAVS
jgi:hypothetical protein